jgi:hypothetical protein
MESIGTFEWRYTLSSIRPRGVVEDKSGNYALWELPEYKQNNKPERVAMGLFWKFRCLSCAQEVPD